MKTRKLFAAMLLGLTFATTAVFAAADHKAGDDHTPQHGGIVVGTKDMDFELVANVDAVTLYLRDHGKDASTAGGSGKLTLLTGTEKSEVMLVPAGGNKLQAKGSFKIGKGTKAVATVTLPGKRPMNVRFSL